MVAVLAAAPEILHALEIASSLAGLIMQASTQLNAVSGIIKTAQAEGRKFTPEEWAVITQPSDVAIAELTQAIAARKNPNANPALPTDSVNTTTQYPIPPRV